MCLSPPLLRSIFFLGGGEEGLGGGGGRSVAGFACFQTVKDLVRVCKLWD